MVCKIEQLPFFQEYKKEELKFFAKGIDLLVNDNNEKSFKVFLSFVKDDLKQLYDVLRFTNKHKQEIMDLTTFSKLDKYDRNLIKGVDIYSMIINYRDVNINDYLTVINNILINKKIPSDIKEVKNLRNFTKYLCAYCSV